MHNQTEHDSFQAIVRFAVLEFVSGKSESQVEQALYEKGLDTETAKFVISAASGTTSRAIDDAAVSAEAKANMLVGLLILVTGAVVTAVTYQMAANSPNGGRYILAWGAIVFGAIQFGRGVSQALQLR